MNKGWVEWVANSYQTYWQRAGSLDSPFQTIFGGWFPYFFLLDGCSSYDLTSYIKDGAPEDATILCPRSNSDWHQMVLRLDQPPWRPTPGTIKPRAALLKQEGVGTKKYTPSLSLYKHWWGLQKTALTFNPVLPTKYHSEYKIVQFNTVDGTYLTAKGLIGTAWVTHHPSHT